MKSENSWRYSMMFTAFIGVGLVIAVQLVRLQFSPQASSFIEQAARYAWEPRLVNAPRGQIYDRWGNLLAGNRTVYEVGVELAYVEDPQAIAFTIHGLLGEDYARVLRLASMEASDEAVYNRLSDFTSVDNVEILKNQIDQRREDIRASIPPTGPNLEGLVFRAHLARSFPEGLLAATILGFVGQDEIGYHGIEEYYDELLAGTSQEIWVPRDPNRVEELPEIPPGDSLVLTIDRELQAMVEEILDNSVEEWDAAGGTIVVMDPNTGEIYAMASTPHLNPNEFSNYDAVFPDNAPFNWATSKSYEPGSVFKIFTMAAAIDLGLVTPETPFFDTGEIIVGEIPIRNWDNNAWGPQNMLSCMQHSLNVCLAWVGTQLKAGNFYDYMRRFGFGHITGIDIAGEATGRLKEPGDGDWYPADLGTNTFGQGISVTPVQMLMAISAIANEGHMVTPHIVRSLVDGSNQFNIQPQFAGQPISSETARIMTEMLTETLENKESLALVSGIRVAGKSGTGEISTLDGYSDRTNASFVGWGPVDDPQFIVYVWLEDPTPIWGSLVAAPVFKQVVERLVVSLNLPPDNVRIGLLEDSSE
ncbi:MAG: penicillin-binding protein 2 [Chloroflexi bacterium]|nr:penicillin-binding protein 2 [Chloroflexota bacterium]